MYCKMLAFKFLHLPDMKTTTYSPWPVVVNRCFNRLREGRTSNAGGSVDENEGKMLKEDLKSNEKYDSKSEKFQSQLIFLMHVNVNLD